MGGTDMDETIYQAPVTSRYGCAYLLRLWSESTKQELWRLVWAELARAQVPELLSVECAGRIAASAHNVDIAASRRYERELGHDLLGALAAFREQLGADGRYLHLGATSSDIEDNADAVRINLSLRHIEAALYSNIRDLLRLAQRDAAVRVQGWTHLQPAEPLALGLRWCVYAYELRAAWDAGCAVPGKGFKGPVGNYAGFLRLFNSDLPRVLEMERRACAGLGLAYTPVARQTSSRAQDVRLLARLSEVAAVLHKLHQDLRLLLSPAFGELHEIGAARRVSSSAMPAKANPIGSERICSLARAFPGYFLTAWHNAATQLLERDLTDSANRRSYLPEALLNLDYLLEQSHGLLAQLNTDPDAIRRNLERYAETTYTAALLQAVARNGGDPQEARLAIRDAYFDWLDQHQAGSLLERLAADPRLGLSAEQLAAEQDAYTGAQPGASEQALLAQLTAKLYAELPA